MLNSDPNKAKQNQKILKIGLIIAGFVLFIGIIFLFTNDPKRKEFVEKQEVKNKLEATKLVNENDTVKTKWINDVSSEIDLTKQDTAKIIKENEYYKKEIEGIKKMLETGIKQADAQVQSPTKTPTSLEDLKKMPDSEYFGVPKTTSNDLNSEGLFNKFPQPFEENKTNYKPSQTTTKTYTKMEQTLMVNEVKREAPAENEDAKKKGDVTDYIPTGSILKVTLLNGMDAPTMAKAKTDPIPVLMKVNDLSILPNKYTYDLKECFVLGEGYGDLSSERVYIRTNNLSCISNTGKTIDMPFKAMITGEDGKAGLRGRVVSKQGAILARTIMANFVSAVGTAFGNQGNTIIDSISATTGVNTSTTTNNNTTSETFKAGLYQGMASGANKLADFFLKLADQIYTVIEIDANRQVELISTSKTHLKFITEDDIKADKNEKNEK